MATLKYPWNDPRGKFSPFKLAVLLALFLPFIWLSYLFQSNGLGSRPLNAAIHEIGLWTIRLLFLALAITPAMQLLQWPKLLLVRRMIGVGAFAYVLLHLTLYIADQAFNLWTVATEIVVRIYLTIGFVALLGLLTLASTSTDAMVRKLGRKWTTLHRIAYAIALLAIIHHFMQSKVNVDEPFIMSGLFVWLMAWRAIAWTRPLAENQRARKPVPLWASFALAVAASVLTMLGEALYYWLKMNVAPMRLINATLAVDVAVRPAWYVLGIALALVILGVLRSQWLRFRSAKLQPKTA